ncbi:HNH endonuclease [Vreelandella sp. H-I2]
MARLKTVQPRVSVMTQATRKPHTVADRRITGRELQRRRFSMWQASPYCADCGKVVEYPHGFHLDHKTPLEHGGADSEENCQLLCVVIEDGKDIGCHARKTAKERCD